MTEKNLDLWWSDRTTAEKEHIADRVNTKLLGGEYADISYPVCTTIWLGLSHAQKQEIWEHCRSGHGFEDAVESEGKPHSY